MKQPRRPLFCANWKMNLLVEEACGLASDLSVAVQAQEHAILPEIVIAPSFPALVPISNLLAGSPVRLAAQTCNAKQRGAFTGEVSPWDLASLGCTYVILGHSERRTLFRETNHMIAEKVFAALQAGLSVILCVGEPKQTEPTTDGIPIEVTSVLTEQLEIVLSKYDPLLLSKLIVAYEPVWAIGTGKVATSTWAQMVHRYIRQTLHTFLGPASASIRILYGGSFTSAQVHDFLAQPDVDGALVGTASLTLSSFLDILGAPKEKTR